MKSIIMKIVKLWNSLPDDVRRVIHTAWQTFLTILILGGANVLNAFQTGGWDSGRIAIIALIGAAIGAAFSAAKAAIKKPSYDGKLSN